MLQRTSRLLTVESLLQMSDEELAQLNKSLTGISTNVISNVICQFENQILPKIKAGRDAEKTAYYENVLKLMKAGQRAEMDYIFWREVALKSKMKAEIAEECAGMYFEKLMQYQGIERAVNQGTLQNISSQFENQQPKK